MSGLVKADWYKVRKSGAAALVIGGTALCAALLAAAAVFEFPEYMSPVVPVMFIFFAAFAAAVLYGITAERDFAGGMRNKVITGHTKAQAYCSMYIVNTLVAYACAAVFLGIVFLATVKVPLRDAEALPDRILYALAAIPSFTALYSLIGVIWRRRWTAVACIVTLIVLMWVSMWVFSEYMDSGEAAGVLGFFNNLLPTGQAMQLLLRLCSTYLPLYSLGFCALCWTASLLILRRSNLV